MTDSFWCGRCVLVDRLSHSSTFTGVPFQN
jgi:hypothetical protein